MKVAVVGSGAMGGLFGSILTGGGVDVTLVDIWQEHVTVMRRQGITVVRDNKENVVPVHVTTQITDVKDPDLIIIFVKSYDTEQAARDCLQIVTPNTMVLTLQNGVGNTEKIGSILGRERIIAGTTSFGCTVLEAGKIKPSNIGEVTIGELDGAISPRLTRLKELFQKAGIETHVSDNIDSLIWSKLVVNVGINAITAITLLTNGQLLDFPESTSLLEKAAEEGIRVARHKNIRFLVDDPLQWVKDVAIGTYHNKSSMRQDIERGKKTEVDFINGAIVAEGAKAGIPTPVNQVLTLLVKSIEHRNRL